LKYKVPSLERRTTCAKAYGMKVRCNWEGSLWGTCQELGNSTLCFELPLPKAKKERLGRKNVHCPSGK
jgi:hypothetical protein